VAGKRVQVTALRPRLLVRQYRADRGETEKKQGQVVARVKDLGGREQQEETREMPPRADARHNQSPVL